MNRQQRRAAQRAVDRLARGVGLVRQPHDRHAIARLIDGPTARDTSRCACTATGVRCADSISADHQPLCAACADHCQEPA